MLAKLQLLGNLAVRQAVSYQGDNFFFALRQQTGSVSIDYPTRARRHELFNNVIHLAGASPNLAFMNGKYTWRAIH
jgi:hypothetical protein